MIIIMSHSIMTPVTLIMRHMKDRHVPAHTAPRSRSQEYCPQPRKYHRPLNRLQKLRRMLINIVRMLHNRITNSHTQSQYFRNRQMYKISSQLRLPKLGATFMRRQYHHHRTRAIATARIAIRHTRPFPHQRYRHTKSYDPSFRTSPLTSRKARNHNVRILQTNQINARRLNIKKVEDHNIRRARTVIRKTRTTVNSRLPKRKIPITSNINDDRLLHMVHPSSQIHPYQSVNTVINNHSDDDQS